MLFLRLVALCLRVLPQFALFRATALALTLLLWLSVTALGCLPSSVLSLTWPSGWVGGWDAYFFWCAGDGPGGHSALNFRGRGRPQLCWVPGVTSRCTMIA